MPIINYCSTICCPAFSIHMINHKKVNVAKETLQMDSVDCLKVSWVNWDENLKQNKPSEISNIFFLTDLWNGMTVTFIFRLRSSFQSFFNLLKHLFIHLSKQMIIVFFRVFWSVYSISIHSFNQSFTYSFVYTLIHPILWKTWGVHSFIHTLIYSSICIFDHPIIHSLIDLFIHWVIHLHFSLTHYFLQLLIIQSIHSLSHCIFNYWFIHWLTHLQSLIGPSIRLIHSVIHLYTHKPKLFFLLPYDWLILSLSHSLSKLFTYWFIQKFIFTFINSFFFCDFQLAYSFTHSHTVHTFNYWFIHWVTHSLIYVYTNLIFREIFKQFYH